MENLTIKISPAGRATLRLIAALTGEKHYEVLDRLLEAEKQRITLKDNEISNSGKPKE